MRRVTRAAASEPGSLANAAKRNTAARKQTCKALEAPGKKQQTVAVRQANKRALQEEDDGRTILVDAVTPPRPRKRVAFDRRPVLFSSPPIALSPPVETPRRARTMPTDVQRRQELFGHLTPTTRRRAEKKEDKKQALKVKMREEMPTPTTSELGDAQEDEALVRLRLADFDLHISCKICVIRQRTYQYELFTSSRDTVSIEAVKAAVMDKLDRHAAGSEIQLISAIFRSTSTASTATRKFHILEEFGYSEWAKAQELLERVHERFLGKPVEVCFEVKVVAPKEAPREAQTPAPVQTVDISTPPSRRRRTDDLLEDARARQAAYKEVGDYHGAIADRWKCTDEKCRNYQSFCFVDYSKKYYNIEAHQHDTWAKAIPRKDADVEKPPALLYNFWTSRQGPVGGDQIGSSKAVRTADKDAPLSMMEQMAAFSQQSMQMRMMEHMERMAERSISQSTFQQPSQSQPAYAQQLPYPYPHPHQMYAPPHPPPSQPYWPHPSQVSQLPPQPPSQPPPYYPRPMSQPPTQPSSQPPPLDDRRSSPIDAAADPQELVERFFIWKLRTIKRDTIRARLVEARQIAEQQIWSLDDLKRASDTSSRMYELATRLDIPDGLCRSFQDDIRSFKQAYKSDVEQGAVESLLSMQAGGGFVPNIPFDRPFD